MKKTNLLLTNNIKLILETRIEKIKNFTIRHLFYLKIDKESIFFYKNIFPVGTQRDRDRFFPSGTLFEPQIETRSDNICRKMFSYLPCNYCESFQSWQLQIFPSICPGPGWNARILIGQCMLGVHPSLTISDHSGELLGYILSPKSCRTFLVSFQTEGTLVAKSAVLQFTVFKCLHFSKDWMSYFYMSEPFLSSKWIFEILKNKMTRGPL